MSKRKGDRTINFDTAFHKALDVLSYLIFISCSRYTTSTHSRQVQSQTKVFIHLKEIVK